MKQNKYPEALMIEPMKINKIPEGKEHLFPSLCESGEYFAQLKKDGYWYMLEITENHMYLFSRTASATDGLLVDKAANVPHITNCFKMVPPGTIIIGEIYYHNKRSKDVTPIMGSLPEKAWKRQCEEGYGMLNYYIHDMIYFNGKDLTQYGASIRYELLKLVYEKYYIGHWGEGFFSPEGYQPYVELAERVDENIQEAVAAALEAGEEGMVLKKKTAPYTPGKRPAWDTIKIKKTDTCDAVCMGWYAPTVFYDGKLDIGPNYSGNDIKEWPYWAIFEFYYNSDKEELGYQFIKKVPLGTQEISSEINHITRPVTKPYYYDWVTSMQVGAYDEDGKLVEIGSISSGLNDTIRENAGRSPAKYIGKVVELAGMEKDCKERTLRHFHFKKFRDDKNPNECLIKEIF